MNESDYSRKFREAIEAQGAWCVKLSDRFHASYPDLVGCYKGRAFCVEMKVHPGKMTQGQEFEMNRIISSGSSAWLGVVNKKLKNFTLINWATGERVVFPKIKESAPWLLEQVFSSIKQN